MVRAPIAGNNFARLLGASHWHSTLSQKEKNAKATASRDHIDKGPSWLQSIILSSERKRELGCSYPSIKMKSSRKIAFLFYTPPPPPLTLRVLWIQFFWLDSFYDFFFMWCFFICDSALRCVARGASAWRAGGREHGKSYCLCNDDTQWNNFQQKDIALSHTTVHARTCVHAGVPPTHWISSQEWARNNFRL